MPPHPPPCFANEVFYDGTCYPRPVLNILRAGNRFNLTLDDVQPQILPMISGLTEDGTEMVIKNTGTTVGVTISSVKEDDASAVLKQLGPADANTKLP